MDQKPLAATASGSVANNTYRVGEFVYMDSKGAHPYLIRRIEEFTKVSLSFPFINMFLERKCSK